MHPIYYQNRNHQTFNCPAHNNYRHVPSTFSGLRNSTVQEWKNSCYHDHGKYHAPTAYTDDNTDNHYHPEVDTTEPDKLFNVQCRLDGNKEKQMTQNRTTIDYHLFAPKFENHSDYKSSSALDPYKNYQSSGKRDNVDTYKKIQDRRGVERNTIYYSAANPINKYNSREDQVDFFNRNIDSMHLPQDMQRPVATRDNLKRMEESLVDNDLQKSNRNTNSKIVVPQSLSFEDMFY